MAGSKIQPQCYLGKGRLRRRDLQLAQEYHRRILTITCSSEGRAELMFHDRLYLDLLVNCQFVFGPSSNWVPFAAGSGHIVLRARD